MLANNIENHLILFIKTPPPLLVNSVRVLIELKYLLTDLSDLAVK